MFSKLYSWSPKQLLGLLIALFTCLNAIAPTLATNTTHVTLVSNQGDRLDMSIEATQHSSLLKNMLEDLSISELQDGDIPILKVNTETLKRFIDYCEQNKEEAVHDEDYYLDTPYSLNEYDRVVLDGLDDDALFSLTMAADFMGAEQLLQATTKKIAEEIQAQKTVQELRDRFGIVNDFTPQEEKKIQQEHAWVLVAAS